MRFQTLYEGRLFFIIFIGLLLLSGIFRWSFIGLLALLGFLFCLNFFRDPDRPVPSDERAIVAAADGVVADIVEMEESEVLKTKCVRIGIFLSVFDVHVNKAPIAGRSSTKTTFLAPIQVPTSMPVSRIARSSMKRSPGLSKESA
jgi:phosphatidylserine decarboxylase